MTLYHDYDIVLYLLIYAFLGWCIETLVIFARDGKLKNRGLLHQPLILTYGFDMVFLILGSGVSQTYMVIQFLLNIFRVTIIRSLGSFLAGRAAGSSLRVRRERPTFRQECQRWLLDVVVAAVTFAAFKVLHPFVFALVSMLPALILKIICLVWSILVLADYVLVRFISHLARRLNALRRKLELSSTGESDADFETRWQVHMKENKLTLGYRLAYHFQRRLMNAYPQLERKYTEEYEGVESADAAAIHQGIVFAEGICLRKLVWVCLITALLGDLIETVYCRLLGGVWMRRSGVVFGPFSLVWGIGAVLLTVILYRLIEKGRLRVFLGGFFLGGTYEYMASVVLEVIFHTKFWDYTDMPLNIGGRTNIPYMVGWGLLALLWVCVCYPIMSRFIEKFPPIAGTIATWAVLIVMCLDLAVTGLVMIRYNARKIYPEAQTTIDQYIDDYYTDEEVEEMWPNLVAS